jgi:hypothetical protein
MSCEVMKRGGGCEAWRLVNMRDFLFCLGQEKGRLPIVVALMMMIELIGALAVFLFSVIWETKRLAPISNRRPWNEIAYCLIVGLSGWTGERDPENG